MVALALSALNDAADDGLELRDIHRLYDVFDESRVAAVGNVVLHAVARERHARNRPHLLDLLHERMAGAIGETDVADDQIEGVGFGDDEGFGEAAGGADLVALAAEEAFEDLGGIGIQADRAGPAARGLSCRNDGEAGADTVKVQLALGGVLGSRGSRRGDTVVQAMVKSAARTMGSTVGRQIIRGVLGSLLGGSSSSRR